MFGKTPKLPQGKQQGKIRLPKQSEFPDSDCLASMLLHAEESYGQEIELAWSLPDGVCNYSVSVRLSKQSPAPVWNIWHDDGVQAEHAGTFETRELDMILDVILMLPSAQPGQTTKNADQPAQSGRENFLSVGKPAADYPYADEFRPLEAKPAFAAAEDDGFLPLDMSSPQAQSSSSTGDDSEPDDFVPLEEAPTSSAEDLLDPRTRAEYARHRMEQGRGQFAMEADPGMSEAELSPERTTTAAYQGTPVIVDGRPRNPHQLGQAETADRDGLPAGSLPSDFFSDDIALAPGLSGPTVLFHGDLRKKAASDLLLEIRKQRLDGMLEVIGDSAVSQAYFELGEPRHAQTGGTRGDQAIKELVSWSRGEFKFFERKKTEMRSCSQPLEETVGSGIVLRDQLRHLEDAGLTYESLLVLKHKELSETELKLMLSKGHDIDFAWQYDIYNLLRKKRTFTDLLRDRPMDVNEWVPLLFNFLQCGLLDLKEPSIERGDALAFLNEGVERVKNLKYQFTRPETGILTAEAMLYFLEYEYYRYEAYDWPLSLILFEMTRKRPAGSGGDQILPVEALNQAALRINLVKRPLDTLGHFDMLEFALLMPNTKPSRAAFIANRIMDALTNTPLSEKIKSRDLLIYFGVAGLPADGDDLALLVKSARRAKEEAREGTFPIVLSRAKKGVF